MASENFTTSYYLSPYTSVESVFLVCTLVSILLVSLAGGVIMIFALYANNKMWTSTNMLIGNLALINTCLALCVMPFHLLTTAKQRWTYGEGSICIFSGFSTSLLLLATIFTHMVISIDKYFAIVRPMSRFMTVKKTGIAIAIVWIAASFMSIIPLGGLSRFEYNPTTLTCGIGFPKSRIDLLYLLLLAGLGFILPLSLMSMAYTRVYIAVKKHSSRLMTHSVWSTDVLSLQRKLLLTVFVSLVCFLICWSTFFALTVTALIIKDRTLLPRGLGIAAYWTGYLNSAINPLVICSLSSRFKEGFINIWKNAKCLAMSPCLRRSRHIEKRGAEAKSTFLQVMSFENADPNGSSGKSLQDHNDVYPQAFNLCISSYSDHGKTCRSSASDNSPSSSHC